MFLTLSRKLYLAAQILSSLFQIGVINVHDFKYYKSISLGQMLSMLRQVNKIQKWYWCDDSTLILWSVKRECSPLFYFICLDAYITYHLQNNITMTYILWKCMQGIHCRWLYNLVLHRKQFFYQNVNFCKSKILKFPSPGKIFNFCTCMLRYFQYSLQSSESVSEAVECVAKHVSHTTVFCRAVGLCTRGHYWESTAH